MNDDTIITLLAIYAALLTLACAWLFDKWTDALYKRFKAVRMYNELADKYNRLLTDAQEAADTCNKNFYAAHRYRQLYENAVRNRYDEGDEWKRLL